MANKSRFFFINLLIVFCFYSHLGGEEFLPSYNMPTDDLTNYSYPSIRYLNKNNLEEVLTELENQSIYLKQNEFYNIIISQEELGHIGYHAAGPHFRVFQDIIRITLEEILGLEFKKDFYFFRIPGDPNLHNYSNSADFLFAYPAINDNVPEQRDQLISVNFTIYSNFKQKYECTPVYFEKGRSNKPPNFEEKISLFFDFMGMPSDQIASLFLVGKLIEHKEGGTMFQLFDLSHQSPLAQFNAYSLLDKIGYACIKKGVPLLIPYSLSSLYEDKNEGDFLDQYRIVVNNEDVLNPYSSLTIRRYDLNNVEVIKNYEKKLRTLIKSIPIDPIKANFYKKQLMQLWKIE